MWATWEGFQFSLQEASDFVQLNTEQVVERIVEALKVNWFKSARKTLKKPSNGRFNSTVTIFSQSLELEAAELGRKATSGDFLNPNEKPAHILGLMRQVRQNSDCIIISKQSMKGI